MRDPYRDEGSTSIATAAFRSHNRAPTNHFGSMLHPDLARELQSHFQRGTGLSPILPLEQHPRTTDVSGGAPMPVAITIGPITQWDLQFIASGPRFISHSNNDSCVPHGLSQSLLISFGFTKDSLSPLGGSSY
jgi:hypothetical protein